MHAHRSRLPFAVRLLLVLHLSRAWRLDIWENSKCYYLYSWCFVDICLTVRLKALINIFRGWHRNVLDCCNVLNNCCNVLDVDSIRVERQVEKGCGICVLKMYFNFYRISNFGKISIIFLTFFGSDRVWINDVFVCVIW